jgi:sialic acid synthase SpsE
MIEKHFTLDRNLPGVDQSFAAEPQHLRELIREVREAEARLAAGEAVEIDPVLAGRATKVIEDHEQVLRGFATRSVFSIQPIKAGEAFTRENLRVLRPGELPQGLHPREFSKLIAEGKAKRDSPQWKGLQREDVQD